MKKKKKVSLKGLIIMIIIAILIIIGVVVAIINIKKSVVEKESSNEKQSIELPEGSLIDVNNMENAKIEDGKKINTSEKAHEKKSYEGLEFTDLTIDSSNGQTNIFAKVTNTKNEASEEMHLNIVCLDKDGQEIGKIVLFISEIESNSFLIVNTISGNDLINLYDYKIEKIELPE